MSRKADWPNRKYPSYSLCRVMALIQFLGASLCLRYQKVVSHFGRALNGQQGSRMFWLFSAHFGLKVLPTKIKKQYFEWPHSDLRFPRPTKIKKQYFEWPHSDLRFCIFGNCVKFREFAQHFDLQ